MQDAARTARLPDVGCASASEVARPAGAVLELESAQQDGDLIVSRGWRRTGDDRGRVIVVAPAAVPPAPATLERLAHEYGLKDELDGGWAAQPLELTRERGRTLLVLADPGGVPLAQFLGRPMDTARFLRLGIGLAEAVAQAHRRGLIHKDIRPANVLVDEASGAVHLTGFGQASCLPREHPAPEPPEAFAGALAYMAPEQTGRMNRSVDSRSDLYAVGVTLYEMLTGAPPFSASDPMEWVHAHIARAPQPPDERVPGAPHAISAVVIKCLAKTAEDRYQTAAGLKGDLERCLNEWEAKGSISPFSPGAHEVPDVLRIPERLYGREREVAALLEAFELVRVGGAPELVLVSGYSGVGKSSVVNELHRALTPRGQFASGKFDQYKRDIPYSTLAQAFNGLIRPLLGKRESELARWRDELRAALEPNAALMVALVPDLKLVIGEPPPVPDLPPQEAEHRFRQVVHRFIGVFARPEHPLVLFLDDLQWLDAASLALLVDLATQSDVGSLLLVGAYRDNEVDRAHPLMRSLDAIRRAGGKVRHIVLSPLAREDVERLIAESLHCTCEAATPLALLVYEKTGGNPFFTIQFVTALADEKLLAFDPAAGCWRWDLSRIRAKGYTDNVVELMVGKLARLSPDTQDAMRWLAALGHRADFATLGRVTGRSPEAVHTALWPAVRAGLVLRQDEVYAFLHDRVREAAYSLIPEAARARTHLSIGRALSSTLTPGERAERIFEVVNQLNRGAPLVDAPDERERIAELDLEAGKHAMRSTAYASALAYLTAGVALLADEPWARRYDLAFPLELNRAECEFLTGDLESAERRLAKLWTLAADTVDRAAVTRLRLDLYTPRGQVERAVAVGRDYLRGVGIDLPPHPTDDEVRYEYERIWARLGDREIRDLVDLPLMTDPESLATLDVLINLATPAFFTDLNLNALIVFRAVALSLQYGNSDGSCPGYTWLACIAGRRFGDFRTSFALGRLACDLVEQRGLTRFQARTYLIFGAHVAPGRLHVGAERDLVRRALDISKKSGELTHAGYCYTDLISLLLATGDPLAEAEGEAESGLGFAQAARFGLVADTIAGQLGLIRTLRGKTAQFGCFDDEELDECRIERDFVDKPGMAFAACRYWIRKMQARFFAGDYAAAVAASSEADGVLWTTAMMFEAADYHFYRALSLAAAGDTATSDRRRQRRALAASHKQLELWAENSPDTYENRAALVSAEIARIGRRDRAAMRLYEQAIRSARDNGFMHHEALANELAGRFYLSRGIETTGLAHLRNARGGYALWGADGKVRQLDHLYPQLAARDLSLSLSTGSAVRHLDVTTLVKASQAISAEIELPRLIQTVMSITLQNAGADRGLLILPHEASYRIEAEARTRGDAVEVELRQDIPAETDCPEAVVNYVIHARESVILDDASRAGVAWEGSPNLRLGPPRSVLCAPLLWLGKLGGVLYLENSQATYAFTPERVAVLELLATRAAIALENARLYADLHEREAKIRRLVESNIIGIFLWSLDGAITEANDAFLAIVGYDRKELLSGRVRWSEMTPPEWRDGDLRAIEELEATGRCQPFEKEFFRKDAGRVPVLVGAATFTGAPEEGVAFVLDLSEQKQAEQRQKVMVDELNHRVKNTLATVLAIASQTRRTATSPEAFHKAFQSRLMALSKTHDLLNRERWTGVSLRDLVEQEAAPHVEPGDGRLSLAGGEVRMGPIAAVTLGLALQELTVNAAKYGALSVPEGRVRVSWRPSAPGRLKLEWEETGGPRVEPPERRGYGSTLIGRVLPNELGGEVRLDFPPQGVRCTMDMALDRVTTH